MVITAAAWLAQDERQVAAAPTAHDRCALATCAAVRLVPAGRLHPDRLRAWQALHGQATASMPAVLKSTPVRPALQILAQARCMTRCMQFTETQAVRGISAVQILAVATAEHKALTVTDRCRKSSQQMLTTAAAAVNRLRERRTKARRCNVANHRIARKNSSCCDALLACVLDSRLHLSTEVANQALHACTPMGR